MSIDRGADDLLVRLLGRGLDKVGALTVSQF
jgi:hypothetical protein